MPDVDQRLFESVRADPGRSDRVGLLLDEVRLVGRLQRLAFVLARLSAARSVVPRIAMTVTVARMPMTTTTIRTSTSVKPTSRPSLRFVL